MTSLGDGARVARGATYMFVQGMLSNGIGVIFIGVLAHLVSLEEMGVYAILTFILTGVQILGVFALPSASAKYIAQYMAEGNPQKARSVVTRVLQMSGITSVIIFIVLYVAADWVSVTVFGSSEWTQLFQIVAVVSGFMILLTQTRSFLQGLQRFRELAALGLAYTLLQKFLALYLILYPGWGLYSVPWSWLVAVVVCCCVGLALTAKSAGLLGTPHALGTLVKFSLPLYLSNSLAFVAGWVDQIFILPFMGAAYLGMYHIAVSAIVVPNLITTSIVTALLPKLSELHAQHGTTSLKGAFSIATRYAVGIGYPIIIGIAILANPILILFAGPEYGEAALPLTILCLSLLATTLAVAVSPTLLTMERTKTASLIAATSILSNTAASYVTLAYLELGMIGTALARVLSALVSFGLALYALKKIVEVKFDTESLWKPLLATGAMAIAIIPLQFLLEGVISQIALLLLSVIVGALVYPFALVVLRAVRRQDIELIHEYLPGRFKWIAAWLDRLVPAK